MFGRILKKDLKRNRTMNIILFLFVIIASVFFASGIYNLVAVMNGTDYMFEKAGIGDYQLISMGENVIGSFEDKIKAIPEVKSYKKETTVFFAEGNVKSEKGKRLDVTNTGLACSVDRLGMRFFDKDNNEVTSVDPGKVMVTGNFMRSNDLKPGDRIVFEKGDIKETYEIQASCKDSFLGSEFMGNPRILMNDADFQKLMDDEVCSKYYGGEVFYIFTDDTAAVSSALSKLKNVSYSYPVSMVKMAYVMNLIVAFVVVILSICLMIVSFLVLRFSINFSIGEDFREIGVMKAIGIRNRKIRVMYLVKYTAIAVTGSVIGFFISIPFGKLLLDSITRDMVLGTGLGILWNVIGSILVALLVVFFAYMSTGKVNKLTPVDAVRSGQTGERFRKKGGIRISGSRVRPSLYLALNDILSSPKRFLTVIITFTLCTLLMLVIVNTANTMNSDKLLYLFGPESDVYINDTADAMSYMNEKGKESLTAHLDDMAKEYTDAGMPCKAYVSLLYNYEIGYDGQSYSYTVEQDINNKSVDYRYSEGSAPSNKNEIAVTEQFVKTTGAGIGDSVKMDFGEGQEEMLITGRFQSMNNLGNVILLHEDAATDFSHIKSVMQYRLIFTDDPDPKTIDQRIEKIKDMTGNEEVYNAAQYCVDSVRVYYIMDAVAKLLLVIVLIVVVLITILMERSFIANETGEIAISKAIGFKNKTVISWHVLRFAVVAAVSMLLAVGLSIPVTKLTISPVFGMMGASDIDFNYDIIKCFLTYPAVILAVTVLTAFITALYTRKINSRDAAGIE